MQTTKEFQGKVIVITGASSGFGKGAAVEFARRGASVVLAARSTELLHGLARECEGAGGEALAVPTDVSQREAVENLARQAIQRFGRFDVWINDAGVAAVGRFDTVPLEDHEQVIKTDLLGTIYGSHCALRHFRERGEGTLINVASAIGKIPAPLYASYAAAKFGVVGLSDALRQELRHENVKNIHVCTVMPMAHDTDFFEHAGNYTGHKTVPIPPTYDPKVTVDALVRLAAKPEDEVITGSQGKIANFLHHLMPHAVERLMAFDTETAQMTAPPGPITSGSIHTPSEKVSGGQE
ncbi:MAG: SDR family oxidoreductase [Isosphaeraceae bacterium]